MARSELAGRSSWRAVLGHAGSAVLVAAALLACAKPWQYQTTRAVMLGERGRYSEGALAGELAIEMAEADGNADPAEFATLVHNVGTLHSLAGREERAGELLERALALRSALPDIPPVDLAVTLDSLGLNVLARGDATRAQSLLEQALIIYEEFGSAYPDVTITLNHLAQVYRAQGNLDDAVSTLERVVPIEEQRLGPEDPRLATTLDSLAFLYGLQGRTDRSLPLHERALRIYLATVGPDHPDVALALENSAYSYDQIGRADEARSRLERAARIRALNGMKPFSGFDPTPRSSSSGDPTDE